MCNTTIAICNSSCHDIEDTRICDARSTGRRHEKPIIEISYERDDEDSKEHKHDKSRVERLETSTQGKVPSTSTALPSNNPTDKTKGKNSRASKRECSDVFKEHLAETTSQSAGEENGDEWKMRKYEWKDSHARVGRREVLKQLKRK
ncbi:hypothetical protein MMC14_003537 [Varicellaria rhodocarpa]|nr:hypothetical protein [Varicellaria rhodocarpa]